MRQCSYPVAYEKWYARKFEFQDRGSVHEHSIKALVFLWIKAEFYDKPADDLTEDDFEEVECRMDKLSMYCESGKVREIMVCRILYRIHTTINDDSTPKKLLPLLQRLKNRFNKETQWINCPYKERCPNIQHNCANKQLQSIVNAESKTVLRTQTTATTRANIQSSNPENNNIIHNPNFNAEALSIECPDDALTELSTLGVTYEDPTLEELCNWATKDAAKMDSMLESYREWILLGRHAEKMMTAFANARIHSWDNTLSNYPGRTVDTDNYQQGRIDVANRIFKHRQNQKVCDPTLYEDCHRLHVSTSQLHVCGKCCTRYISKPDNPKNVPNEITIENNSTKAFYQYPHQDKKTTNSHSYNSKKKSKNKNLVRICRFRSPLLERICKLCYKQNTNLNFDICQSCLLKGHRTSTNSHQVPYRPLPKTKVSYSTRFDRQNRFHSARPDIMVRRNNPWISTHNRDATLINGGNTDLQLTFHIGRIISYLYNYIAKKEVTKVEIQKHLNASLKSLSGVLDSSYVVTLQRAISAAIAGRTFSTQAAWWQILGLPICDTNIIRDCVFINSQSRKLNIKTKISTNTKTRRLIKHDYYDAYAQRSQMSLRFGKGFFKIVQNYSLREFVEKCYFQTSNKELVIGTRVERYKKYSQLDPVLTFTDKKYPFLHMVQFPELFDKRLRDGDPKGPMYWKWCQLQLTINKSWYNTPLSLWGNFASINMVPKKVFQEKWLEFVAITDYGKEVQNRFNRHRSERAACKDNMIDLDKYANQGWETDPNYRVGNIIGELTNATSSKAQMILESGRNWEAELKARNKIRGKYTQDEIEQALTWIEDKKRECQKLTIRDFGYIDCRLMNDKQKIIWVILLLASRDELLINGRRRQIRMQVRGKPGTGKSYVIKCAQTDSLFIKHARVTATTGSAACLIGGSTIHSLVLLPFKHIRRSQLDGTNKHTIEENLRYVRVIIVDEKSMFSQEQLGWLDMRLKAAQPDKRKKLLDFGGYHIFFFGDFSQLPPVVGRPLHDKSPVSPDTPWANMIIKGKELYKNMPDVLELTKNYRIHDTTDAKKIKFIHEMHKIGNGTCSGKDITYWQQYMDHVDPERTNGFSNDLKTTFLFPTNKKAATVNSDHINSTNTNKPLFQWPALNTTERARKAKLNDVNMLRSYIGVREGSNIMTLVNLWQRAGICNGGRGVVRDVVFDYNSDKSSLPLFVVVELPAYTGPPFPKWNRKSKAKWVPIPVYIATLGSKLGGRTRSARHQIPIALTRALTHHKSQGMSLSKIYIKLYNSSQKAKLRNSFGLLYTSISRITDPENLLIERFGPEVLNNISNSPAMAAMQKEFLALEKKRKSTTIWANPLLIHFKELFRPKEHCRRTQATISQLPINPEKAINILTQPSKTHGSFNNKGASVNDYYHSHALNPCKQTITHSINQNRPRKRRRRLRKC